MGYASLAQTDSGLHMRQRSRAFIIGDPTNSSTRVVFINADIAMGDTGVRRTIVAELSALYPEYYNNANIAFVGTHQHSGVGGYVYIPALSLEALPLRIYPTKDFYFLSF